MTNHRRLILEDETYRILGACFEVYRDKGCGFLEPVYQECLAIELTLRDIPFVEKTTLRLQYKGRNLRHVYEPDFHCFGKIILEIKAVDKLANEHRAQLLNYLHAARIPVGLLVNFGHYPKLEYQRFALTDKTLSPDSQSGGENNFSICRETPLDYVVDAPKAKRPRKPRREQ